MKKIILAIAGCSLLLAACKKTKELADINIDIPYSETGELPSLPAGISLPPGGATIPLPAYGVETHINDYLRLYNTTPDKVISGTMKALGMRLTSPAGANFNFMDSIWMYISVPGQPQLLAGWRYDIPKGVDTFALNTTADNLKAYFLTDTINVQLKVHVNSLPSTVDSVRSTTVFHLYANPLN